MAFVRTVKSLHRADSDLVGHRAVDLSLLDAKGYLVPLSFVITNEAFEGFITANRLVGKIAEALESRDAGRAYDRVRELLLNGDFPNGMVGEIVEQYESLGVECDASLNDIVAAGKAPFVNLMLSPNHAVPDRSAEGIVLNVRGLEELLLAIKECWACLFTPAMIRHRQEAGIGNRGLNTGVIVQHMPRGEVTGEAASAHGSDTETIVVRTYYGAPDIGGMIEKDEVHLTREFLKPVFQSVAIQTMMLARDENDRLGKVPIGLRGEEQKLDDRTTIELGRLAKKASQLLDAHAKLLFNVRGETVKTLLCNRLLLTKGSVKLQGYRDEERIEEGEGIGRGETGEGEAEERGMEGGAAGERETGQEDSSPLPAARPVASPPSDDEGTILPDPSSPGRTETEEEIALISVDEETGEADVVAREEECGLGFAAEAESPRGKDEERLLEPTGSAEEEADDTILDGDAEGSGSLPVEATATSEGPEESIFAGVEETLIRVDEETGEADVVTRTEREDDVVEDDDPDSVIAEGAEEAKGKAEPKGEYPDGVERRERTFDEAYAEVREVLTARYRARFRHQPPESMTELFFELTSEVIIPHEELIGKMVRIFDEEQEYDQEIEERILAVIDDFLDRIR